MTPLDGIATRPQRWPSEQAVEPAAWGGVSGELVRDVAVPSVPTDRPEPLGWRLRLRRHLTDPFFRNAYALIINTGLTGALGLAFWAIAARTYTDPDVGRGSALISAMTLLSGIVAINLAGTMSRFIPETGPHTGRLVRWTYALSSAAVVVLVVGFLLSLGRWGPSYALLRDPTTAFWFVGAVVAAGIFTVQDGVLVGLRSAAWVPVENVLFGIAKIVLLLVLVTGFPHDGVYLAWVVPMVLLIVPVNVLIFRRLLPRHAAASVLGTPPPGRRVVGRFFVADYVGGLCMFASATLPPVLVAPFVEPHTFAYFYIAWITAGVLNLVGTNLAASLTVEGVYDRQKLAVNCLAALRRGLGLTVLAAVVLSLLAPYGLELLGRGYLDAAPMLQALALAAVPRTVIEIWIGVLRAGSRIRQIAYVQVASGGLVVAAVLLWLYLRSSLGSDVELITGVGLAVLAAQVVVALTVVPGLRRFLREVRPQVAQVDSHVLDVTVVAGPVAGPVVEPVAVSDAARACRRQRLLTAILAAAGLAATAATASGLSKVRVTDIDGHGLVSALPASVLAGLAVLTLTFLVALGLRRPHRLLLAGLLVATVCCLHGATLPTSSLARFPVTWIHVGFVEYISRTGTVVPTLDARFSWPGFFALGAFWLGGGSWQQLVPVLSLVPALSNLLYLLPMALLLSNLRMTWQARWFAAWLFCVFNWIGQDYFSPQGYTYGLYLLFVAGLVAWLRPGLGADGPRSRRLNALLRRVRIPEPTVLGELPPNPIGPRLRCALLCLVVGVFVVATFSHQLTPFIMLAACTGLVLTGRCVSRGLPLLLAVLLAAFISYLAVAYWSGHLGKLLADIGDVGGNISTSIVERTGTGQQHQHVVAVRIGLALSVAGLAAVGALRRRLLRVDDRVVLVLLAVPLVGLGLQSYGGEIALRVFLFTLPAAAALAACAFFPELRPRPVGTRRTLVVGASMLALVGAFLTARYGNEAYERTDTAAAAAVEDVYRQPGAVCVVALTDAPGAASEGPPFLPIGYRNLERVSYANVVAPKDPEDVTGVIAALRELGPGAYLVTADQTDAYLRITGGYPTDWSARFARRLAAAPELRLLADHGGAAVYVLREAERVEPAPTPAPPLTGVSIGSTRWTPIGVVFLGALVALLGWRELRRLRGIRSRDVAVPLLVGLLSIALLLVVLERLILLA